MQRVTYDSCGRSTRLKQGVANPVILSLGLATKKLGEKIENTNEVKQRGKYLLQRTTRYLGTLNISMGCPRVGKKNL